MEATRELQQEKLRSTHQRDGSGENLDHGGVYKAQFESISHSLRYLILRYSIRNSYPWGNATKALGGGVLED